MTFLGLVPTSLSMGLKETGDNPSFFPLHKASGAHILFSFLPVLKCPEKGSWLALLGALSSQPMGGSLEAGPRCCGKGS